jgi:acyl-coenzyme A thioesterase 9
MKHTFELAFCCCASFAHARPSFVSLDPSTFMNPVPVGSVLYLTATVAYTDPPLVAQGQVSEEDTGSATGKSSPGNTNADEPNEDGLPARSQQTRVQIRVDSHVKDVEHGQRKPTGQFNYTFTVDKDVKVVPQTYEEFVTYLEARRRVDLVDVAKGKRRVADSIGS